MSAQIIDGKAFAAKVRGQVAEHVTRIKKENLSLIHISEPTRPY